MITSTRCKPATVNLVTRAQRSHTLTHAHSLTHTQTNTWLCIDHLANILPRVMQDCSRTVFSSCGSDSGRANGDQQLQWQCSVRLSVLTCLQEAAKWLIVLVAIVACDCGLQHRWQSERLSTAQHRRRAGPTDCGMHFRYLSGKFELPLWW